MLRNLFSEVTENVSLFLGGMLLGVALGIIATLICVTAYITKDKE
ncbi:membrane protein [Streptomyces phage Patelgo]|nr:membrane protein [Streptomyces phage Patelgo]